MDAADHTGYPVSASAERLDGKQHGSGLGHDPQYSLCPAWRRDLCNLFSEEKERQDIQILLAPDPAVISLLYSGCGWSRLVTHAWNAHAPQNHLLHPYDHSIPAFGKIGVLEITSPEYIKDFI